MGPRHAHNDHGCWGLPAGSPPPPTSVCFRPFRLSALGLGALPVNTGPARCPNNTCIAIITPCSYNNKSSNSDHSDSNNEMMCSQHWCLERGPGSPAGAGAISDPRSSLGRPLHSLGRVPRAPPPGVRRDPGGHAPRTAAMEAVAHTHRGGMVPPVWYGNASPHSRHVGRLAFMLPLVCEPCPGPRRSALAAVSSHVLGSHTGCFPGHRLPPASVIV